MDWHQWLRVLQWRALEEADAEGTLIAAERRAEATARTRGGLTTEDIQGEGLTSREAAFLAKRAEWLERETLGWSGPLVAAMAKLTVPKGRWSWAFVGWIGAVIFGYSITGLGQTREFNLLALPLVGVLIWNAVVMVLSLAWELWPKAAMPFTSTLAEWCARGSSAFRARSGAAAASDETAPLPVEKRFAMLAGPIAWERLQRRLRAWLHIAAALVAIGSAVALYARGWSREYRAVWESTLLTERHAHDFFGTLFAPASRATGIAIPLHELTGMHRTGGKVVAPAPALPWIHLYAATLVLLVAAPRLVLAALTLLRVRSSIERRARRLNWPRYLKQLLRAVEGGEETITLLVHARSSTADAEDIWTRGIKDRFGHLARIDIVHLPPGQEDEFLAAWTAPTAKVVLVFNVATTPEPEVQRRLVADVRQSLMARQRDAEFLILLDATTVRNRWTAEKLAGRERLWTEMLQGVATEVMIASCKDARPAPPPLPARPA